MDFSTKVNIVLCILSFILAVVSVITVIITLRQNNKMIAESTRPYITIYIDSITICEQTSFFVLKNFGHCAATITRFKYDECLKNIKQNHQLLNEQFDYVQGLTLAPGQTKLLQYNLSNLGYRDLTFIIEYIGFGKCYKETITLNSKNYIHIPLERPDTNIENGCERQVHTLREIAERLI